MAISSLIVPSDALIRQTRDDGGHCLSLSTHEFALLYNPKEQVYSDRKKRCAGVVLIKNNANTAALQLYHAIDSFF
jgi:hypothetical protein